MLQAVGAPRRPRPHRARPPSCTGRRRCCREKAVQRENDATLTFWNFCAELEGKGFKRAIDMEAIEKRLGAEGPVAMVGYAFDAGWAAKNRAAVARFLDVAAKAKDILAASEAEWQRLAPRIGVTDKAGLDIYRQRYSEGIPRRPIARRGARRPGALPRACRDRRHRTRRPGARARQGDLLRSGEDRLNIAAQAVLALPDARGLVCGVGIRRTAHAAGPQTVGVALWNEAQSGALALQSRRDARPRCGLVRHRHGARHRARRVDGPLARLPTGSPIPGWWRCSTCRRSSSSCSPMCGRVSPRPPPSSRSPSTSCPTPPSRCARAPARSTASSTRWRRYSA